MKTSAKGRARGGGRGVRPGRGAGSPDLLAMSFDRFAEVLDRIVSIIDWEDDVSNCDVSKPGCFIDNNGNTGDRAEAFLALLPIVERIRERRDAAREAARAAAPVAAKGRKL